MKPVQAALLLAAIVSVCFLINLPEAHTGGTPNRSLELRTRDALQAPFIKPKRPAGPSQAAPDASSRDCPPDVPDGSVRTGERQ
jgi:hypothetical protein